MKEVDIKTIIHQRSKIVIDNVYYARINNIDNIAFIVKQLERKNLSIANTVKFYNIIYQGITARRLLEKKGKCKRLYKKLERLFKRQYVGTNVKCVYYNKETEELYVIGVFRGIPYTEYWIFSSVYNNRLGFFMLDSIYLPIR